MGRNLMCAGMEFSGVKVYTTKPNSATPLVIKHYVNSRVFISVSGSFTGLHSSQITCYNHIRAFIKIESYCKMCSLWENFTKMNFFSHDVWNIAQSINLQDKSSLRWQQHRIAVFWKRFSSGQLVHSVKWFGKWADTCKTSVFKDC